MRLFARKRFSLVVAFVAVVGAVVFLAVSGAGTEAANGKSFFVTIYDSGTKKVVKTNSNTVEAVLEEVGVELDSTDKVEPGVDEEISSSDFRINIYRSRPVLVVDGMKRIKIMTSAQTSEEIIEVAELELLEEDVAELVPTDNFIETGIGAELVVTRSKLVKLKFYGEDTQVRTQAVTVGEFLQEKGIGRGKDDYVSVADYEPVADGMSVAIWRNGKHLVTTEEVVKFDVVQTKDFDKEPGYKKVTVAGENGKKTVTYEVVMKNGKEVSRKATAEVVTKKPKAQKEVVGAKISGNYTTPSENERITWDYLTSHGFSPEQTAGIMGNLMQEHHFNTDGDGLAQWIGGRKAQLMARKNPYSIYTQLDFLMYELNGGYAHVKKAILATNSIDEAMLIFQNKFEICGMCMEGQRLQYAHNIYVTHKK